MSGGRREPPYQYDSECREALAEGAVPAMRYAAHRLRALGDERTASWLFRDADKIEALSGSTDTTSKAATRAPEDPTDD